jgi:hypothetical protein
MAVIINMIIIGVKIRKSSPISCAAAPANLIWSLANSQAGCDDGQDTIYVLHPQPLSRLGTIWVLACKNTPESSHSSHALSDHYIVRHDIFTDVQTTILNGEALDSSGRVALEHDDMLECLDNEYSEPVLTESLDDYWLFSWVCRCHFQELGE